MIYFIKVILVIKDFKTISQQVEILKNKGLIIDDVNKAENILLKDSKLDNFIYEDNRIYKLDDNNKQDSTIAKETSL